jgi:hypothetical protein
MPGWETPEAVPMPSFQPFADAPPSDAAPGTPPPADAVPVHPAAQSAAALPDPRGYVPLPTGMAEPAPAPSPDPSAVPTSAWVGTAAVAPTKRRSPLGAIVSGILVVFAIAAVGYVLGSAIGLIPNNKGQILFGTSAGGDLCSIGNETKVVGAGDPVYFTAILKHHMDGDQAVRLHVTKDGAEFGSLDEPADGTAFDCLAGKPDVLGSLDPGLYHFDLFHNTDVESTGDLTVK